MTLAERIRKMRQGQTMSNTRASILGDPELIIRQDAGSTLSNEDSFEIDGKLAEAQADVEIESEEGMRPFVSRAPAGSEQGTILPGNPMLWSQSMRELLWERIAILVGENNWTEDQAFLTAISDLRASWNADRHFKTP
jgi:hypothetical protein